MHKPIFNRVAILGLGLIGSSIARALSEKKLCTHIAAFDVSKQALDYASKEGFIHSQHGTPGQAAQDADLIIFAAPPTNFASLAKDIAPFIKTNATITDVASAKRQAVAAITPHLPKGVHFVPGHPIAGSEKSGVEAGRADLFAGKRMILTPEEKDVMRAHTAQLRKLWEALGARIEYMPPDMHDRIYAYISHLPQLVAFSARIVLDGIPAPKEETYARFVRLMGSDAALWADISIANADMVAAAIDDFTLFATQIAGELAEEEAQATSEDPGVCALLFPKVIATCLVASASLLQEQTGVHPAHYAGSGFADMTASAVDDPDAAMAAISSHHRILARMLTATLARLSEIKDAANAGDASLLIKLFKS